MSLLVNIPTDGVLPRVKRGEVVNLCDGKRYFSDASAAGLNQIITQLEKHPESVRQFASPTVAINMCKGSCNGPVVKVLVEDLLLALDVVTYNTALM